MSQFLLTVLRYIRELKSYLPDNFILNVWGCHWFMLEDEVFEAFLRRASLQEYEEVIKLLIAHTVSVTPGSRYRSCLSIV
jgi:hypothetical protein